MFSTDRVSADLRMAEYKRMAESSIHLAEKKKVAKTKKSFLARMFG